MDKWAIVVGINEYPGETGQTGVLRGAVADACDFAEWALDPAGGGVPNDQLYFWAHPWPQNVTGRLKAYLDAGPPDWDIATAWAPADRTRAPFAREIVKTIERKGRELHDSAFGGQGPKRRVMVFLAGHGLRTIERGNPTRQTCFIAGDFRPETGALAEGLIPCDSFRRSLRNQRFDEALLFFDCCRNDFPFTSTRAQPICDYPDDDDEPPEWSIGNAAGDNQRAYETVTAPYRGAFTKTLVTGLRTSRDAVTGGLTVDGLARYVSDNIASATDTGQAPEFRFEPKAAPLVIVAGTPGAAPPVRVASPGPVVRFNGLAPGTRLILRDGFDQPVPVETPIVVGIGNLQLGDLTDGLYSIEPEGAPDKAVVFKQPRDRHVQILP